MSEASWKIRNATIKGPISSVEWNFSIKCRKLSSAVDLGILISISDVNNKMYYPKWYIIKSRLFLKYEAVHGRMNL